MKRIGNGDELRLLHGAAALLVLALLLFSVRPVLSPFVLFLVLLLVLTPYAGTRPYALIAGAGGALTALWLLKTTGSLLAPFILALVLAYILDPVVDAIERRRVPRAAAIGLLGLPVALLVAAAIVFGIPALVHQVEDLIRQAPVLVDRLIGWLEAMRLRVLALELPGVDREGLARRLQPPTPTEIEAFLAEQQAEIARRAWQGVVGVGRGLTAVLTILGYIVLTPVLVFYLLRDWDRLKANVAGLIPGPRRPSWLAFFREYDDLLSRYLRGQVMEAAIVGVLTWLGLWLLGFPYSGLVGAVAGIFNLVPYLGLVVSAVPALIIALLSGSVLTALLKAGVVFAIVQFIDGSVTGPRIVGGSVGLHPVWIMLALALGGFFFGLVGLLIAVPAAVLLKLLIVRALARYRASAVYREVARPAK